MARARNIKPGFFSNDLLAEIEPLGRILFAGLWTIADREGRMEDRVKKIKAQVLPYDDCDCAALLQALDDNGFILRYEVDNNRFIQIVKWNEHQNPHAKEADSSIPAPYKNSASTVLDTTLTGTSRADSLNPLTDSLNPHLSSKPAAPREESTTEFEDAWLAYPPRSGASKADSLKAWKARIKAGECADEILAGVKRYAAYVEAKGTEDSYIKQPATFFGPGNHFKSNWTVVEARASPLAGYQSANEKQKSIADRLTGHFHEQRSPTFIDLN
jgi:hypothetical protein